MYKQEHSKKIFQGVTRLFETSHLKLFFHSDEGITRWVLSEENNEEGTDFHLHFVVEGDKLPLAPLRQRLKEVLFQNNIVPRDYKFKNGDLNINSVRVDENGESTVDKMIQYILKQGNEIVHGYNIEYIKWLKSLTYMPKKISMTKAILKLKEECINGNITISDYTFRYRKVRNSYRKPDPYWFKEYDRMEEQTKSDDDILDEVYQYERQRELNRTDI